MRTLNFWNSAANLQEAIESWYLDRLVPWFMYVAQYVGLLALFYGISYTLTMLFQWELPITFLSLFILSGLLYHTIKERRGKVLAKSKYIAQTPAASTTIDMLPTYDARKTGYGYDSAEERAVSGLKAMNERRRAKVGLTITPEDEHKALLQSLPTHDATLEHDDDFAEDHALAALKRVSERQRKAEFN